MMMERDDLTVLHEPFSQLADFGSSMVDGRVTRSEPELIDAIRRLAAANPVFFKDTTDFRYPGVLADRGFLREATHTFLVRHPREVIASHYALNPKLTCDEIGFARLHELYLAARDATGRPPVVVDADDLLDGPERTVRAYCDQIGLPFRAEALRWSAGMPDQWRQTERWHVDAANSGGFTRAARSYLVTVDNDPVLAEYYSHHLPFYAYLHERRLRV